MKRKRYSEEQVIKILQEIKTGKTETETCRQYQVSDATVYRWRRQNRGMDKAELKRLKELEQKKARLKKIVA